MFKTTQLSKEENREMTAFNFMRKESSKIHE